MHVVGVRELKNRLTHYLSLTRQGVPVIVTDRSEPIAVLHGLGKIEEAAGTEERLASLAHLKPCGCRRTALPSNRSVAHAGEEGSDLIIEERR